MALAPPWQPGLSRRAVPVIQVASRAVSFLHSRMTLGPSSLGLEHRRGSFVRQNPHRNLWRRPSVSVTATAAASTLEEGFGAVARRRVQPLLSSPHDKEIWAVSLPALVAMLLEPVMNALNAGLVGHLGTQQLSAVSLGNLAVSLCTFFYTFLLFLTVPDIAAAVVRKDDNEVSCIAAKSLWIAGVCGLASAAVMYNAAGAIVGVLNPPEAVVAAYAVDYIKIRSLGIPAVLLGFVATGVFRGFKDTRTPMIGAVVSAGASLGLNYMFLNVLRMGVTGSAVATAAAQAVSCVLLLSSLLRGGRVFTRHLSRPPPLSSILPTLQLGAVLGARNMVTMGMVIYASALSIRIGSANQASFEIIRQVWILAIQFFECLNVATQALCASYIGKEDRAAARSLLERLLVLGIGIGGLAGCAVWLLHQPLIAFFTRDPRVVAQVLEALPMLCLFFPLDAAASIMDGSLLAAKQSNYMSVVQVAGSVVQYFVLAYLAASGNVSTLTVWAALKIIIVTRVFTGISRNYFSPKSAYLEPTSARLRDAASTAVPATAATLPGPTMSAPTAAAHAEAPPPSPSRSPAPDRAATEVGIDAARILTTAAAAAGPLDRAEEPRPAFAVQSAPSLQSIEDDVMVLAAAACASATDMQPELLRLKQRQSEGGGGGRAAAISVRGAADRLDPGAAEAGSGGTVSPSYADGFELIRVPFGSSGSGAVSSGLGSVESTGPEVVGGQNGVGDVGLEGGGAEGNGGAVDRTSTSTAAAAAQGGASVAAVEPVVEPVR